MGVTYAKTLLIYLLVYLFIYPPYIFMCLFVCILIYFHLSIYLFTSYFLLTEKRVTINNYLCTYKNTLKLM